MTRVRVRRVRDVALPRQAHPGDAGFDLAAAEGPVTLAPFGRAMIPTGLIFEIPHGFEIQVRPRSGLAAKRGITILNAPGTIDAGYRGEVCVILYNATNEEAVIERGERIAQAVFARVETIEWEEAEELAASARGEGGFGSTGI